LRENLSTLWSKLEQWVPYLEFEPLWFFPLLERKTTLREWLVELDCLVPSIEEIDYALPASLQDVKIWSDLRPKNGAVKVRLGDGRLCEVPHCDRYKAVWPYWSYLYSHLRAMWQLTSRAELDAVNWQVDAHTVKMLTTFILPIRGIEKLNVKGSRQVYWILAFQPGQPSHIEAVSNAELLNLQLLMLRGGNKLLPIEVDEGELTMALQMPRADTGARPLGQEPLPDGVIEQVAHYILVSVLPGYSDVSRQLETLLSTKIARMRPHVPPFEVSEEVKKDSWTWPHFKEPGQEFFYKLEWALEEMVWLRAKLTEHMKALGTSRV
jgi:hypothetical protein